MTPISPRSNVRSTVLPQGDTCRTVLGDALTGLEVARAAGLNNPNAGVHWHTFPLPNQRGKAYGNIHNMRINVSRHIADAEDVTQTLIHESLHASLKDFWSAVFDWERNAAGAAGMCRDQVQPHPAIVRPGPPTWWTLSSVGFQQGGVTVAGTGRRYAPEFKARMVELVRTGAARTAWRRSSSRL